MTPRLAQIGLGRWGKNIEKTLRALPECTLAYTATHDWEKLLEKNDIDGVLIATPPHTHAQIAIPFLKRGLPVFIEKPMTVNLKDARAIEAAAKSGDAQVMVGHIHLYSPAYKKTKELAATVGPIQLIVSRGHNQGPYREDFSALWDWAPHDISMMLDLLDETPQSVAAWGVTPTRPDTTLWDFAQIKLNFSNNRSGFVMSSWLLPPKCKQFTIVGSHKSIIYEDSAEKKVAVYENGTVSYPPYENAMALTEELAAFVRTVTKKEEPRSNLATGLGVVRILDAAERSIAQGGTAVTLS